MALCQTLAGRVPDQAMMVILRRRQAEERLKNPLDRDRSGQIFAPRHMGDFLERVVDHDRKVIGGRPVAAAEHDVAGLCKRRPRVRCGRAGSGFGMGESGGRLRAAEPGEGGGKVESDGARAAACAAGLPAGTGTGRVAPVGGPVLRRARGLGDVAAGAGAGVGQARFGKPGERGVVGVRPGGLKKHRPVPVETQPMQILFDPPRVIRADAARIEVFHAQEEPPACGAGAVVGEHRRKGVAEMEPPRGTGGETLDMARIGRPRPIRPLGVIHSRRRRSG